MTAGAGNFPCLPAHAMLNSLSQVRADEDDDFKSLALMAIESYMAPRKLFKLRNDYYEGRTSGR